MFSFSLLHLSCTLSWTKGLQPRTQLKCKDCSKSNSFHFMMLVHDVGGGCWWYGSRGWTFLPIFPNNLLPTAKMAEVGQSDKWHLTWKWIWSKGVPLAPTDIHQCLLNVYGDLTKDVSTLRWWVVCFSRCNHSMKEFIFQTAVHIFHTTKWRESQSVWIS